MNEVMPHIPATTVIKLPRALPPAVGLGAYLKAVVCVVEGDRAYLSADLGNLEGPAVIEQYQATVQAMVTAMNAAPGLYVHDLHPDYYSSHYAAVRDLPSVGVQHHYAHVVAVMAEHGIEEPVLGLSLDGFGLGSDGKAWGGELLRVSKRGFERLGHLSPLAQPGGDVAARQPWRMAAAALHRLGQGEEIASRFASFTHAAMLGQMLDKGLNCPETSSCGRLFDAACGFAGLHLEAEFEGQAPMALEALVTQLPVISHGWRIEIDGQLNCLRLLDHLSHMDDPAGIANLFHGTLVAALADWTLAQVQLTGLKQVVFSGGCFLNKVLSTALEAQLVHHGVKVLKPIVLPPGDQAISLGQAVIGAWRLEQQQEKQKGA